MSDVEVMESTLNETGDQDESSSETDNQHVEESEESTDGGDGHSSGGAEDEESEEEKEVKQKAAAKKQVAKKAAQKELAENELDNLVMYKVDGVAKKITVREALRLAQKGESADKRFQESAADKKAIEKFLKFSKEDPKGYLRALGHDPVKFAIAEIDEYLKEQEMDPKDKQIRDFERKQKEWDEKQAAEAKQKEEAKRAEEDSRAAQDIDTRLLEAFKKSGLPNKKFYMQQMTARAMGALSRDEELNFDDIADKVKSSVKSDISDLIGGMDAQAIHELLGDKVIKKIIDAKIQKVTGKAPSNESKRPAQAASPKPGKAMNEREWDRYMESLKNKSA